jgi:hypothetical protein
VIELEVIAIHPYYFFFVPALEIELVVGSDGWCGEVPMRRRIRSGGSRSGRQSLGLRWISWRTCLHHRSGRFLIGLFLRLPIRRRRLARTDILHDLKLVYYRTMGDIRSSSARRTYSSVRRAWIGLPGFRRACSTCPFVPNTFPKNLM